MFISHGMISEERIKNKDIPIVVATFNSISISMVYYFKVYDNTIKK